MKTLIQNAFLPYLSPVRFFIFLPIFTRFFLPKTPDSCRDGIPGFNFLHFACGRLPKGTIEKRREEKRREEKRTTSTLKIMKLAFHAKITLLSIPCQGYKNEFTLIL